ncbi:MAG TPA: hypothetical protein VLB68_18490 [Pyrinomonadaceae bacterium]|nr:hypothetical protein [Pyrinomonadaceae bacterium]
MAKLPLALIMSLVSFFGVPLMISAIVLYQGAFLQKAWRQAIGKGFLAVFLWLFPSVIIVVGNLLFYGMSLEHQKNHGQPLAPGVMFSFLTGACCVAGLAFCRWVSNYDEGNHWLLNNHELSDSY